VLEETGIGELSGYQGEQEGKEPLHTADEPDSNRVLVSQDDVIVVFFKNVPSEEISNSAELNEKRSSDRRPAFDSAFRRMLLV
jgi:hypothetical protein